MLVLDFFALQWICPGELWLSMPSLCLELCSSPQYQGVVDSLYRDGANTPIVRVHRKAFLTRERSRSNITNTGNKSRYTIIRNCKITQPCVVQKDAGMGFVLYALCCLHTAILDTVFGITIPTSSYILKTFLFMCLSVTQQLNQSG